MLRSYFNTLDIAAVQRFLLHGGWKTDGVMEMFWTKEKKRKDGTASSPSSSSPLADSLPACPDKHRVKLVTRVLALTSPHLPSGSPALGPLPPPSFCAESEGSSRTRFGFPHCSKPNSKNPNVCLSRCSRRTTATTGQRWRLRRGHVIRLCS